MAISTLLLDLGNVLVGVDPDRTVAAFSELAGHALPTLEAVFLPIIDLNTAFDRGDIGTPAFRMAVNDRLGIQVNPADFDLAWCAMLVDLVQTEQLIAELSNRYALYLLSNTDPIHIGEVRRRHDHWLKRFTGLCVSYEARVTKPEAAFFEYALERFELDRASCVFLDDRAENVAGAQAIGIQSHQVTAPGLDREQLVAWSLLPGR